MKTEETPEETFAQQDAFPPLNADETYPDDFGDLSLDVRRALVALMRGPYLWRKEKKNLWETMIKSQDQLRRALGNVFLDLVIDEDMGVAFVRQAQTDSIAAPSLLNTYRLRFIDSVVLLKMREILLRTSPLNERALIRLEDISETIRMFDPAIRNDEALLAKRQSALVNRLLERHLLLALVEADNFEISPVLKLIFDGNAVGNLIEAYKESLVHRTKSAKILSVSPEEP